MLGKILPFLPDFLKVGVPAVASFFFGNWTAKRKWNTDEDGRTLKKLISALPSFEQIERHFSAKAMTDPFKTDVYDKFYEAFYATVSNPSMNFIDPGLKAMALEIQIKTKEFLGIIAIDTFPTRNTGEQSVRRIKYGDSIDDFATGERLNIMADEIFNKYKALIAQAKKKQISID